MKANPNNILDNLVPTRIALFKEYRNPEYIFQLLRKNSYKDDMELFETLGISYSLMNSELTFTGNAETLHALHLVLIKFGVELKSFTYNGIIVSLEDFFNKII